MNYNYISFILLDLTIIVQSLTIIKLIKRVSKLEKVDKFEMKLNFKTADECSSLKELQELAKEKITKKVGRGSRLNV